MITNAAWSPDFNPAYWSFQADTGRINNNVIITLKRRRDVVLT